MTSIEDRLAIKRETGKWPDHPDAVDIPDKPDPPKLDIRICPHCHVTLRKNKNRGGLTRMVENGCLVEDEFLMVCPTCGFTPY